MEDRKMYVSTKISVIQASSNIEKFKNKLCKIKPLLSFLLHSRLRSHQ